MRKSSSALQDFSIKTRQSYVAIILIIYKTYIIIVKQAWPFLIYFVIGGSAKKSHFLIGLSVIALVGMIVSIIKFFRYYFYIKDEELIIEQGVFSKARTNVPFDRVQTINLEQNLIHRIFNVVKLKVDTAGSAGNELEFHAIAHKTADSLRELILSKRKTTKPKVGTSSKEVNPDSEYTTIMKLEPMELLKAGMAENHLRSGGLIFAFLFYIWQGADDLGMEDLVEGQISKLQYGVMLLGVLLVFFIIISFLISLVRMVVQNYDLKFYRSASGFKINAGLFTKRDVSALDSKIQVISWADNPLKKLLGISDLRLKQAVSKAINVNKTIKIPSCKPEHIQSVTTSLYGLGAFSDIEFKKIHPSYFHRIALYVILFGALALALFYYIEAYKLLFIASIAIILILTTRYLSMKKKRYGHNEEMLMIHGGTYGDRTEVLPIHKIQSCSVISSPYQRRKQLASLTIFTASGRVGIPYIPLNEATRLADTLIYFVEKDRRKWM